SVTSPGEMRAVVRRVVRRDHQLTRQQPLYPQTPLIECGLLRGSGTQVVQVGEAPVSQWSVFGGLGSRQSCRKGILQGRESGLKVVLGEIDDPVFAESGPGKLKIGGDVHSIVDTRAAANHGARSQL